jgi:hypothetical protein
MPDDQQPQPPLPTFDSTAEQGVYILARRWADQVWPVRVPPGIAADAGIPVRTLADTVDELATTAVVAATFTKWLPVFVHHALLDGASVEECAAALGVDFPATTRLWRDWSNRQLALDQDTASPWDHTAEHALVDALVHAASADRNGPRPRGNVRLVDGAATAGDDPDRGAVMDLLRDHLEHTHLYGAAAALPDTGAVELHQHEHRCPGGFHDHDLPAELHHR